jgi:hypothetical protein
MEYFSFNNTQTPTPISQDQNTERKLPPGFKYKKKPKPEPEKRTGGVMELAKVQTYLNRIIRFVKIIFLDSLRGFEWGVAYNGRFWTTAEKKRDIGRCMLPLNFSHITITTFIRDTLLWGFRVLYLNVIVSSFQ